MIFEIRWTCEIDYEPNEKPCKNAIAGTKIRKEYYYIKDENANFLTQELLKEIPCWRIELNSLEELMELHKEVNDELIIGYEGVGNSIAYIEIYNGYRE